MSFLNDNSFVNTARVNCPIFFSLFIVHSTRSIRYSNKSNSTQPCKEERQISGTTYRKVCTYNRGTWLPCQNRRQPMWDIAALLTAIDTFPICCQTTPVDLTVARPFRRVPVTATTTRKEESKRGTRVINAASAEQWSATIREQAFIIIVENPGRIRVLINFNVIACVSWLDKKRLWHGDCNF